MSMGYQIAPPRYKSIFDEPPFDKTKSFYLYGITGTGKTYFSYCITNSLNRADFESKGPDALHSVYDVGWRVVNVPDMVMDYRNAAFEDKKMIIAKHSKGNRIFDDIGAEHQTEFSQEFMLAVLNNRWNNNLWTGFTSNLSIGELPYGDRIKSRIAGIVEGNIHKLGNKDLRIKK